MRREEDQLGKLLIVKFYAKTKCVIMRIALFLIIQLSNFITRIITKKNFAGRIIEEKNVSLVSIVL